MFGVNTDNTEVWMWPGCLSSEWQKIGEGGKDFAVSDEGFYGLDALGTKVYRCEDGRPWEELKGASAVKKITPC